MSWKAPCFEPTQIYQVATQKRKGNTIKVPNNLVLHLAARSHMHCNIISFFFVSNSLFLHATCPQSTPYPHNAPHSRFHHSHFVLLHFWAIPRLAARSRRGASFPIQAGPQYPKYTAQFVGLQCSSSFPHTPSTLQQGPNWDPRQVIQGVY